MVRLLEKGATILAGYVGFVKLSQLFSLEATKQDLGKSYVR